MVTACAGLLFVATLLVGEMANPKAGAWDEFTPEEMRAAMVEHAAGLQTQAYLHAASGALLLVFAGGMAGLLREVDENRGWAAIALAGGVGASLVVLIGMAVVSKAVSMAEGLGADAVVALESLGWSLHFAMHLPLAVFLGAMAAGARAAGFPRWIAWSAGLLSAVSAGSTLALFWPALWFGGLASVAAFFLWAVATSTILLVRPTTPPPELATDG